MVFTYQTTNSNTILQQQNVPLTPTIQLQQHQYGDAKVAALNIPAAVNIVKQTKVPLHYNNATIELVPPPTAAAATAHVNGAVGGGGVGVGVVGFSATNNAGQLLQQQFLQTPANVFFTNYNSQQNVRQLLRNMDERFKNMRNVEMRVATIQVSCVLMQNRHIICFKLDADLTKICIHFK